MRQIVLMLLCSTSLVSYAQETVKPQNKVKFFSANQAAHYEGSSGGAFGLQSVNGITFREWGAGIGAGLDRYNMRSAPLFAHLRRQVPFVSIPLFLYADAGFNVVWPEKGAMSFAANPSRNNGSYWDGGIQYHLLFKKGGALIFSAGYSEKTFSEEVTIIPWCNFGPCPPQRNVWDYRFRRIVMKAGFQL